MIKLAFCFVLKVVCQGLFRQQITQCTLHLVIWNRLEGGEVRGYLHRWKVLLKTLISEKQSGVHFGLFVFKNTLDVVTKPTF